MLFRTRNSFLNILLVLALILPGISPACEFISGKTQVQELPCHNEIQSPQKTTHNGKAKSQCSFCFVHSNVKTIASAGPALEIYRVALSFEKPAPVLSLARQQIALFQPRGPPSIL